MPESYQRKIDGIPSIILDLIRFSAAITVFFVHAKEIWFPQTIHDPNQTGDISHVAVITFFVLSGYVISYTSLNKNRGAIQYGSARLSRLYSILIPGLIISILSQFVITTRSSLFDDFSIFNIIIRYLASASLTNEILFFSFEPIVNGPLWTLSYEFVFYLFFGLWYFKCRTLKQKLLLIISSIIMAPKIMLLFPIWIMGSYSYRHKPFDIKPIISYTLLILFLIIALFLSFVIFPYPSTTESYPLAYSGRFISDYIIGGLIALALIFLPDGSNVHHVIPPKTLKVIREIGDLTFPIYVFHYPLLLLYQNIVDFQVCNSGQFYQAIFTVLLISVGFGYLCNKFRPYWFSAFRTLLIKVKTLFYS